MKKDIRIQTYVPDMNDDLNDVLSSLDNEFVMHFGALEQGEYDIEFVGVCKEKFTQIELNAAMAEAIENGDFDMLGVTRDELMKFISVD